MAGTPLALIAAPLTLGVRVPLGRRRSAPATAGGYLLTPEQIAEPQPAAESDPEPAEPRRRFGVTAAGEVEALADSGSAAVGIVLGVCPLALLLWALNAAGPTVGALIGGGQ